MSQKHFLGLGTFAFSKKELMCIMKDVNTFSEQQAAAYGDWTHPQPADIK